MKQEAQLFDKIIRLIETSERDQKAVVERYITLAENKLPESFGYLNAYGTLMAYSSLRLGTFQPQPSPVRG